MTTGEIGLGEVLRGKTDLKRIDPMEHGQAPSMEHLRKSLMVDLYLSGTNALTEAGWLVNLDMETPCVKTASCHNCKSPMRI